MEMDIIERLISVRERDEKDIAWYRKTISKLEEYIRDLEQERDNYKIDPQDMEDKFDDWLNRNYDSVFGISPARILYELWNDRYEEMLEEFVSKMDIKDDPRYWDLLEEIESAKEDLEEMKHKLRELENE